MAKKVESALINIAEQSAGLDEGNTIKFAISGNRITFGDDELTINIERHEREFDNTLDLCRDKFGNLVMGVIPGRAEMFVAQLSIPAREFEITESGSVTSIGSPRERITPAQPFAVAMAAESLEVAGGDLTLAMDSMDEMEMPQEIRTPIPFELKRCTLTLWALS